MKVESSCFAGRWRVVDGVQDNAQQIGSEDSADIWSVGGRDREDSRLWSQKQELYEGPDEEEDEGAAFDSISACLSC